MVRNNSYPSPPLRLRMMDQVGQPLHYHRVPPFGDFSVGLLRYTAQACDIHREFGDLHGFKVAEIGGGYGGLAHVLTSMEHITGYYMYGTSRARARARVRVRVRVSARARARVRTLLISLKTLSTTTAVPAVQP